MTPAAVDVLPELDRPRLGLGAIEGQSSTAPPVARACRHSFPSPTAATGNPAEGGQGGDEFYSAKHFDCPTHPRALCKVFPKRLGA